jgi:hypothetical protein
MNRKFRTNSRFIGPVLVLFGICVLPLGGIAAPQGQSDCRQSLSTTGDAGRASNPIPVLMSQLQKNPEDYYGKTVSVHGELHRDMTDSVFTIEGDGFFRDKDVLVIGTVPKAEAAYPLEGSLERGKEVSVTGVVQPYDRGKLECAYGPLHLEDYEGHSFTKNPVLIVDPPPPVAQVEMPRFQLEQPLPDFPTVERSKPEPTIPEPAITEPAPEPEAAEPPESLPRTAGQLPLLALAGLLALSGALVKFTR